MRITKAVSLGMAAVLACGACKGTRTDQAVVTRSGSGNSTSPSGDAAAARGKSMVRLVNAVPGQSLEVTGDDAGVFSAVAYKAVTPYVEVKDNVIKFKLRAAGHDSVLAEDTETLADGRRYTIIALPGDHGERSLHVLRDEVIPDTGKARIRVINAAPEMGGIDVAVGGRQDALFDHIEYGHEAGPKDVDPVSVSIELRGRSGNPVRVRDMALRAGRSYTIVLTGLRNGGFEAITFDDAVIARTASR